LWSGREDQIFWKITDTLDICNRSPAGFTKAQEAATTGSIQMEEKDSWSIETPRLESEEEVLTSEASIGEYRSMWRIIRESTGR